jgi:hypothetical protein
MGLSEMEWVEESWANWHGGAGVTDAGVLHADQSAHDDARAAGVGGGPVSSAGVLGSARMPGAPPASHVVSRRALASRPATPRVSERAVARCLRFTPCTSLFAPPCVQ